MNYPTKQPLPGRDNFRIHKIPSYKQEWLASGASPETIDLNVFWSLDWEVDEDNIEPGMDYFLKDSPGLTVYGNRRYSTPALRQWGFLEDGYWGVSGLDPLNGWQEMSWFQAKPVNPPKWCEVKDKKGSGPSKQPEGDRPEYVDKYTWNKVARHFDLPTMAEPHAQYPAGFWGWVEENGLSDKFYLKEHVQKYVSPPKVPTRATFLRISNNQSARHFGEELPPDVDGAAEATGHWQRWLDENRPIVMLEDAGKKSGCAIDNVTGVMPIGLPGICGGVRSQKDEHGQLVPGGEKWLIPELTPFATPKRIIYICFDRDKKLKTQRHVIREMEKLGRLFNSSGCHVRIVNWPLDWGKGIDDVWANGHNIQSLFDKAIPYSEFLLSCCQPWSKFEPDPIEYRSHAIRWDIEEDILADLEEQRRQEVYPRTWKPSKDSEPDPQEYQSYTARLEIEEKIADLEEQRRQEVYPTAWEVWKKSRSLSALPSQTISQQWVSFDLPPVGTGLGVKSAMGTGKTEQIKNILAQAGEGARLFFIAPTNTLNHQACNRLGLKHLQTEIGETRKETAELRQELKREHKVTGLTAHSWLQHELDSPGARFALCPDSLIHFKDAIIDENTIIVLDEARTIADILMFGKTAIKRNRQEIIAIFQELLTKCGRAIALDGTLNDNVLGALEKISGKKFDILANTYRKPITYNLLIPADGSDDYGGMVKKIELNASIGTRFIIGSDSQHFCETMDVKLQDMGLHGKRLDSKTSREGWAKDFFKAPSKWIESEELDYFIFSPSACQGFDISIENYFSLFYIVLFGVLTTDDQAQIATRVRDPNIERYVYCPKKGIKHSSISYAVLPEHVLEDLRQYQIDSWLKTLIQDEHPIDLFNIIEKAKESPLYELRGKRIAQENFERDHLQDCLKYALAEQGEVKCMEMPEYNLEEFREIKEEIKRQNCQMIFNAPDLTEQKAEALRNTASQNEGLSFANKCALKKFDIKNRLPGIEESKSWGVDFIYTLEYDDPGLSKKRETLYLLSHADDAFIRDWLWWHKEMERLEDDPERTLDMSAAHRYPAIRTLLDSSISKILKGEIPVWSNQSEVVTQINARVRSRSGQRNLLKHFGQMTPVACVNEILRNLLGLKVKSKKVALPSRGEEKRKFIREYRTVPDSSRLESQTLADIDAAVARKFSESRAELQAKMQELREKAAVLLQYDKSKVVAPSLKNDINKPESATTTQTRLGAGVRWAIDLWQSMMSSLKEGRVISDLERAFDAYRGLGEQALSQAEQVIKGFDRLILQAFDAQHGLYLVLNTE